MSDIMNCQVICVQSYHRVSRVFYSAWSLWRYHQLITIKCSPLCSTDYNWMLWSMSATLYSV